MASVSMGEFWSWSQNQAHLFWATSLLIPLECCELDHFLHLPLNSVNAQTNLWLSFKRPYALCIFNLIPDLIFSQAYLSLSLTSLVAQMVKHLPAMRETQVQSLGWEDLLEKEMATHSSILAWKIPGWRSMVGYSPWGRKESDVT